VEKSVSGGQVSFYHGEHGGHGDRPSL